MLGTRTSQGSPRGWSLERTPPEAAPPSAAPGTPCTQAPGGGLWTQRCGRARARKGHHCAVFRCRCGDLELRWQGPSPPRANSPVGERAARSGLAEGAGAPPIARAVELRLEPPSPWQGSPRAGGHFPKGPSFSPSLHQVRGRVSDGLHVFLLSWWLQMVESADPACGRCLHDPGPAEWASCPAISKDRACVPPGPSSRSLPCAWALLAQPRHARPHGRVSTWAFGNTPGSSGWGPRPWAGRTDKEDQNAGPGRVGPAAHRCAVPAPTRTKPEWRPCLCRWGAVTWTHSEDFRAQPPARIRELVSISVGSKRLLSFQHLLSPDLHQGPR